jgi:hypothetical protein
MNLLVIVIGKSIRQDWIEWTSELGRIDFFFAHRITTRNGTNDFHNVCWEYVQKRIPIAGVFSFYADLHQINFPAEGFTNL